ncbi:MAG: histidine kinase [Ornithinibacter sp.]
MNPRPRLLVLDVSAKIRLAFAVLSGLIAVQTGSFVEALPWLLLVVVLDLVAAALDQSSRGRRGVNDPIALTVLSLAAAAAGAAFAVNELAGALLILIPAFHAGTKYGRFGYLLACVIGTGSFGLTHLVFTHHEGAAQGFLAWLGAAILLGIIGAWNQRLTAEQEGELSDPAAVEAIDLIQRLQDLSRRMSTGLDAPAGASLALDLLSADVPSARSAVLVTADKQHLVPVALRGSTRAPWHIADDVTALLRTNPASWTPTEIQFENDLGERCALVVPFALGNGSTTVLVAERSGHQPFTKAERETATRLTRRIAPTLQAGLLFGSLRQVASLEERNRIARDIHDGIAQELAALGYSVDALRAKAGPPGTDMRDSLDELRGRLGEAMADLRLHITDLRVAERPDTGLGAVLGSAVQSFGSVSGVRTTMTVSEGRRRLDPRVELLVHRLVMDVLADAQASGAHSAWVTLSTSVGGPATVEISHDGSPARARTTFTDSALEGLRADLRIRTDRAGRTTVNLSVEEPRVTRALGTRPT